VKAFYEKVRTVIGNSIGLKQDELIRLLNPMLSGWAQYHSPVVAKETFARIDWLLHWRLRRWAKRRHPQKSADWVRRKYWRTVGDRHWVFAVEVNKKDGSKGLKALYPLAGTPIQRHTKVKGAYHPYDPSWELYGETLRQDRMVDKMRYRREWVKLYIEQQGKCALCGHERFRLPFRIQQAHVVASGSREGLQGRDVLHAAECNERAGPLSPLRDQHVHARAEAGVAHRLDRQRRQPARALDVLRERREHIRSERRVGQRGAHGIAQRVVIRQTMSATQLRLGARDVARGVIVSADRAARDQCLQRRIESFQLAQRGVAIWRVHQQSSPNSLL